MSSMNFIKESNRVEINGEQVVIADNVNYHKMSTTTSTSNEPLDILHRHIALGALLDSKERFDPPRCDLGTRLAIIQIVMDWITDTSGRSSIMWLHGPAGAGKSALAQSIAEKCKELGILAAVFFFSRNSVSPERSDGNRLIATLVHQLIESFPKMRPYIEKRIRRNISIFDLGMQAQSKNLLVSPINKMKRSFRFLLAHLSIFQSSYPRLFVIDGLDECSDILVQREILEILAKAAKDLKLPFRILICSRPESHIRRCFDHSPVLQEVPVRRLDLTQDSNSDNDIRTYLSSRFREIIETHPLREYILSAPWPSEDAIEKIVSHSSGQFIYAATVVKYIQSPKHRPTDRLEVILNILPVPANDKPYAALDTLYTLIFSSVDEPRAMQIFSLLAIPRTTDDGLGAFNTPDMVDKLLFFQPGDTLLILNNFSSIIAFDDKHSPIRHYHASLNDFLLDPSRSGILCVDLPKAHEQLTLGYLRLIQDQAQYYGDQARNIESNFVAFVKNYGRLTSISNELVTDLENMDFWTVFRQLSYQISHEFKSQNFQDSFLTLYRLWGSGTMEQLFCQLTQSDSHTNGRILQAQIYAFRQQAHRYLGEELSKPLFTLLAQPHFKKSMFCAGSACDRTKNESCQACQNISPLATELSYHVLYSQILCWGAYAGDYQRWLAIRVHTCLKCVQDIAEDMVVAGDKDQTKENTNQRRQPSPYPDYFLEATLNFAILTLPYSDFDEPLWALLEKFEPNIDSWSQPDSALHRFSPRFQELQVQIKAYMERTNPFRKNIRRRGLRMK